MMDKTHFISKESTKQMLKEISHEKNIATYYIRMYISKQHTNLRKVDFLCSFCSSITYLQETLRKMIATESKQDKLEISGLEVLTIRSYYNEYERFRKKLLDQNVSVSLH